MADKPKVRIGAHWKRPPTKVYDYNYDVGQHYYKPMMRHLDKKNAGVASELPGPKTFAERLAEDPLYGKSKPVNYGTTEGSPYGNRSEENDKFPPRRSLDGGDLSFKNPYEEPTGRHRPRLNLPSISDQILEGAGMRTPDFYDKYDNTDLKGRRRPLTADADDILNDPFFSKSSSGRDTSIEDSLQKRRNLLRDIDSELEKIDSGLEKYSSGRSKLQGSSVDDLALTSSSSSKISSSSVNVKKRQVRTTMTTETVRY